MKKYYIVIVFLIVSNVFSQNKKYDTILFKNIKIDNRELFFGYKNFKDLGTIYGKLNRNFKKASNIEKTPLHYTLKVVNSFSNDEVSLLMINDKAFIDYLILNYLEKLG
ncbi:hypothetical protein [Flavobacterium aquidurense]|uniref:Uncharacterized protein n=1 Tax=Flavobacterium aquidurense TaxID=362413 RepID=A0A0Q0W1H4_9FLAO|nr:hypothetical protein [Flavobacterium aquidurense]KQB40453.1 hypothetical protein RC62_343 [Flavobacterium aquidurense]